MPTPQRREKAPSSYSAAERAKLNTYKDAYFARVTTLERTDYVRKTVGPEFFNWLEDEGKSMGSPDSKEFKAATKVCGRGVPDGPLIVYLAGNDRLDSQQLAFAEGSQANRAEGQSQSGGRRPYHDAGSCHREAERHSRNGRHRSRFSGVFSAAE
jgi:hypothetical protein